MGLFDLMALIMLICLGDRQARFSQPFWSVKLLSGVGVPFDRFGSIKTLEGGGST